MPYRITRVNHLKEKNPNGDYAEIEVTSIAFETAAEADAYVKEVNEQHHEYMLRTHDPKELGYDYSSMTDERIEVARQRGINVKNRGH